MKIIKTNLKDCIIIEPGVYEDDRGFFSETYHEEKYKDIAGINYKFVQDNHSKSEKGVLRGLHFQIKKPQGKLVRVVSGEVFDVAVDLRKNSKSYLQWSSVFLSAKNKKQFWVPPGFAHGFLVTSDTADFVYKCTNFYDPSDEGSIRWNDPDLNIKWPIADPKISLKDQKAGLVRDL
jgi:dTDP-4-dehydrorhamnose 3,5-epimerase